MKLAAILLAAGKGSRYHGTKQDELFHGKPLWCHVCDTACEVLPRSNIVVVGKDIAGGETRTKSVRSGLEALPPDTDRVIILEAARPMVTAAQIRQLLTDTHPSTTFVRPLVNTVIYRDARYINREELYELLTPQAFDYRLLAESYRSDRFSDVSDETRILFEYHGIRPHFIETGTNLVKVTYPGDLDLIECIYRAQIKEGIRTP